MADITIIQYEGDNQTFVWKHPVTDFDALSQLVVHESQEAIFFNNGEAIRTYGPGRYTLNSDNLMGIHEIADESGNKKFHCEVYFINKTVQMSLKWGTDERVRFIDPLSNVPLDIGACGELNLQVQDGKKLLFKLVGTTKGIAWNSGSGFAQSLKDSFSPLINMQIKSNLANVIKDSQINLLEIDSKLGDLSKLLKDSIIDGFEEYGLTITEFYVSSVSLPEGDPNFEKIKQLYSVGLQQKVFEAEKALKTSKLGYEKEVVEAQRELDIAREQTNIELQKKENELTVAKAEGVAAKIKIDEAALADKARLQAAGQADATKMAAEAQAERIRQEGSAEVEILRQKGLAEAEVMRAKGYTEKDLIEADVKKSTTESISHIDLSSTSTSGNGNAGIGAGTLINLAAGLAVAKPIANQIGGTVNEVFNGFDSNNSNEVVICQACGAKNPVDSKFCMACGKPLQRVCSKCGKPVTPGAKFCGECGEEIK